jgi:hypothetical protein
VPATPARRPTRPPRVAAGDGRRQAVAAAIEGSRLRIALTHDALVRLARAAVPERPHAGPGGLR